MGVKLEAVNWANGPQTAHWWENFRRASAFAGPVNRAECLAEWGAVWVEDSENWSRYLEFEKDADATAFLLRWS
jgi:hypothetical protein